MTDVQDNENLIDTSSEASIIRQAKQLIHAKSTSNLLMQQTLNKKAAESNHSIDHLIREQKKVDQLIAALNELDRCKKRISQLEEENRRLAIKLQTKNEKKGTPGSGQKTKKKAEMEDYDSDDSDTEDDPHQLIEELENRKSDWQAYLKSFAEGGSEDDYDDDNSDDQDNPERTASRERKEMKSEEDNIESKMDSYATPAKSTAEGNQSNSTPRLMNPLMKVVGSGEKKMTPVTLNNNQDKDQSTGLPAALQRALSMRQQEDATEEENKPAIPGDDESLDMADIYRKNKSDSLDMADELAVDKLYLDTASSDLVEDQTIKRFKSHRKMSEVFEEISPLRANSMKSLTIADKVEIIGQDSSRDVDDDDDDSELSENDANLHNSSSYSIAMPPPQRSASLILSPTATDDIVENYIWENPDAAVFELVENNQQAELIHLLRSFPRVVRCVNAEGLTALHVACSKGFKNIIETLISFNFPLDAADLSGRSPLHHCHDAEIVDLLCSEGADPNIIDMSGLTPLIVFILEENLSCMKIILKYGADPNIAEPVHHRNALHHACLAANYEMCNLILFESVINVVVDHGDLEGNSPLLLACNNDKEISEPWKMIMLLLDKGSSVTISNERGATPLHYICANRMLSRLSRAEPIIELLLELGSDPNAQDCDGCTPIVITVAYREWNLCKILLEAGGDLNIPCNMNSVFLQIGVSNSVSAKEVIDLKAQEIMNKSDCTASDLLPKNPRYMLFKFIKVLQTRIPGDSRDRCMNCGNHFTSSSSFFSSFISSGKHHCRHCHRVVCQDCSPNELPRIRFPGFVQKAYPENNLRVCIVCYTVIIDRGNG